MKTDISKMNFDELASWATGYILFEIGRGEKLRNVVTSMLQLILTNWRKERG